MCLWEITSLHRSLHILDTLHPKSWLSYPIKWKLWHHNCGCFDKVNNAHFYWSENASFWHSQLQLTLSTCSLVSLGCSCSCFLQFFSKGSFCSFVASTLHSKKCTESYLIILVSVVDLVQPSLYYHWYSSCLAAGCLSAFLWSYFVTSRIPFVLCGLFTGCIFGSWLKVLLGLKKKKKIKMDTAELQILSFLVFFLPETMELTVLSEIRVMLVVANVALSL